MRSLYICLLLIVHFGSHAQTYHPFPESDAMWRCGWGENACALNDQYAEYQYMITGDTLIGAFTYHKLDRSGVFDCAPPLFPWSGYMGAFRNDIGERKVYFVPVDGFDEILLYDFTLEIGDTIQGYLPDPMDTGDPNIAVISVIDSVDLAGTYRKRWHYESSGSFWPGFMIEGIGGEFGPLEALMARFDNNGSLDCFSHNSELIYTAYDGVNCDLVTVLKDGHFASLRIYPNPVTDHLMIEGATGPGSMEIHDIRGTLVKRLAFGGDGGSVPVHVADLMAGHYQIRCVGDQGIWQGRFVKVD